MAIYFLSVIVGRRGSAKGAARFYRYITRTGPERDNGDLVHVEAHNLPTWAKDNPESLWRAADRYERSNGRLFMALVAALPNELPREKQIAVARQFAEEQFSHRHPYVLAVHSGHTDNGIPNPHVHVQWTQRVFDGAERSPEQAFRNFNPAYPERGGYRKDWSWDCRQGIVTLRQAWAKQVNLGLRQEGHQITVSHERARRRSPERIRQEIEALEQKQSFMKNELLREQQQAMRETVRKAPKVEKRPTREEPFGVTEPGPGRRLTPKLNRSKELEREMDAFF